jgi:hypothetical protein
MYPDAFLPLYDASKTDPNWAQKCHTVVQIMHSLAEVGSRLSFGDITGPRDLLQAHPICDSTGRQFAPDTQCRMLDRITARPCASCGGRA